MVARHVGSVDEQPVIIVDARALTADVQPVLHLDLSLLGGAWVQQDVRGAVAAHAPLAGGARSAIVTARRRIASLASCTRRFSLWS